MLLAHAVHGCSRGSRGGGMEKENRRLGDSLASGLLPLVPCGISPSSCNELSHSLREAAVFEGTVLDQAVVFILCYKYKLSGQAVSYSDVSEE